jgi:DNA-binding HxlR family transcriptional regulator
MRRTLSSRPKVLTNTLRRLEDSGFIDREIYAEVPLRVEYSLTTLGHSVSTPLSGLRTWVEAHLHEIN